MGILSVFLVQCNKESGNKGIIPERKEEIKSLTKEDFNLTKEYLQKLFEQQNKRCIYTNIEIKIPFRANTILDYYGLDKISNLASLDRIDSTKGYVVGNVQWVLSEINIMKNDLPNEKFLDLCRKVADKI